MSYNGYFTQCVSFTENFHRCREEQEAEERARRAVKRAERLERRRQSTKQFLNAINLASIKLVHQFRFNNINLELFIVELREPPYYANYSKFRLYQHNVVTSKYFDLAIALIIGVNIVSMALEHYLMPAVSEAHYITTYRNLTDYLLFSDDV